MPKPKPHYQDPIMLWAGRVLKVALLSMLSISIIDRWFYQNEIMVPIMVVAFLSIVASIIVYGTRAQGPSLGKLGFWEQLGGFVKKALLLVFLPAVLITAALLAFVYFYVQ